MNFDLTNALQEKNQMEENMKAKESQLHQELVAMQGFGILPILKRLVSTHLERIIVVVATLKTVLQFLRDA